MSCKPLIIAIEGIDGSGKHTQAELLAATLRKKIDSFNDEFKGSRINVDVYALSFPRYASPWSFGPRLIEHGRLKGYNMSDMPNYQDYLMSLGTLFATDRAAFKYHIKYAPLKEYKDLFKYDIVIADRYSGSNAIHLGGELLNRLVSDQVPVTTDTDLGEYVYGHHRDFVKQLYDLDHRIMDNFKPYMTIYLHANSELAIKLINERHGSEGREIGIFEDKRKLTFAEVSANLCSSIFGWHTVECGCKTDPNTMRPVRDIAQEIEDLVNTKIEMEDLVRWHSNNEM